MTDAKPKRRLFRFSLRTLFVVVTVFGCWLGWHVHVVSARKQWIQKITNSGGDLIFADSDLGSIIKTPLQQISWQRRILGDRTVVAITVPVSSSGSIGVNQTELAAIKSTFSEANVYSFERPDRHRFPPLKGSP